MTQPESSQASPRYDFESAEAKYFPKYLMFDIINICNAKCIHCPQSSIAKADDYVPQKLDLELYKKAVDEAARYKVDVVRITGDGEPLIHPDLPAMIAHANKYGFPTVNLTTNGSLLRGRLFDKLMENPPTVFDVSLDAFYPETFAKVRVGLNFDTVKNNVFNLLERRDPKRTRVIVSMIEQTTSDEVEEFRNFWKDKVDFVAVRQLHTNLNSSQNAGSKYAPQNLEEVKRWPCQHLWQRLVVDFRGDIRFCPVDWKGETSLGKFSDTTLFDAWHGHMLTHLRAGHLSGDYSKCGACTNCMDWRTSPWEKGWLKIVRTIDKAERETVPPQSLEGGA